MSKLCGPCPVWKLNKQLLPVLLLICLSACGEGPRETYTELCVDVAKTARQRQACTCLAYEYGKALTVDEFRTVNTMLARAIHDLREKEEDEPVMVLDKVDIDEAVYLAAMQKIALLQRAGICGYATPAAP